MIDVGIRDAGGGGSAARVSPVGQLVVGPYAFDKSVFLELDATGTAFNFYAPVASAQFVVTGLRIKANRDVSATTDAEVVVYEALSATETTVAEIVHEEALIRGESATLLPLNRLVSPGRWINAKTTDASIFVTVFGYYVPVLGINPDAIPV